MDNKMITIDRMPLSEVTTISKVFAASGMFADATNEAKAMVKILAGQEIGIPPFAAMSGIHIIQGKPTIGAGLIASRVKGSGKYDYKVTEQTEKNCSIDFYQGADKIGTSSFSIEDAKKAGTKNIDKFPRNMLFARAISNGVKWYCPDVFSGPVYVPEEMEGIATHDVPHTEVSEPVISESTIDNYVHAVNGVKKSVDFDELLSYTNRMTLETISHPAVQDAICVFAIASINTCESESMLKAVWTSIGLIGKDKEFQKIKAIIEAKDKMKESFKQPA